MVLISPTGMSNYTLRFWSCHSSVDSFASLIFSSLYGILLFKQTETKVLGRLLTAGCQWEKSIYLHRVWVQHSQKNPEEPREELYISWNFLFLWFFMLRITSASEKKVNKIWITLVSPSYHLPGADSPHWPEGEIGSEMAHLQISLQIMNSQGRSEGCVEPVEHHLL